MNIPKSKFFMSAITAVIVTGMGLGLSPVLADVDPPFVNETLAPGDSFHVVKSVDVPDFPPKLDVCLLVDLSGSYSNDIINIKAVAPDLFDDVKSLVNDVQFCLTSFVDFPFSPWGSPGNYAYRMDQDLTPTKATWLAAVNGMSASGGNDGPESQYSAVYQMATGAGNDVPPPDPSTGDIAPGQNPTWRDDATKVLIITTDAAFHEAGDPGPFPYPGPTAADATDALVNAGIKVIALKAPGATTQMDDLAAATGGSVQPTSSSSDDIADAILLALDDLTFDVTGTPGSCDPLVITLDPEVHFDVPGGTTVEFDEWIGVPDDVTDIDEPICCDVDFTAGDSSIGTQSVCIRVKRTVGIDIKPWSFPNSINLKKTTGVIPVAILGSDEFDVNDVDVSTLTFGVGAQVPAHDIVASPHSLEDANGDGYLDLISHYVSGGTGIVSGDTEACISGKTNDGIDFMGCDSVRTLH